MDLQQLSTPVTLEYTQQGEGEIPLLLLHGFPFDRSIWSKQQTALMNDSTRIITPDLRGHGRSPAPEGAYSVDLMARDLLLMLDELDVEKAVWVGHSMGGYITLAAYRLAPERFAGLGLIGSQHLADTPEAKAKRYERAEQVHKEGAEAAVNHNLFAPDTPDDSQYVRDVMQLTRLTSPAGIIGSLYAMAERPDSSDTLRSITVPVLLLTGKEDQLIPAERVEQMAALIPESVDTDVVILDGAGHMPMMEQVPQTTHALSRLMQRALETA